MYKIGEFNAFTNCKSISGAIDFPDSLEIIGEYAFTGCPKLQTVTISEKTKISKNSFDSGVNIIIFEKLI